MDLDVITIGGGVGGSTLASALARSGRQVVVLEREREFKDRVRGENILPWGVAAARRLGVLDELLAAGGHQVPFFNVYFMGTQTEHRPFPTTTPTGEAALNDVLGVIVVSEADAPSCWKTLKPERTEWSRWKEARSRPPFAPTI